MTKWTATVEPRKADEEDATKKQLDFIRQLFLAVGSDPMEFERGELGKWQASSLIDQLIDIKDHGPNGDLLEQYESDKSPRKMSTRLSIGVFLVPFIFVWFLLRPGYSLPTRVLGFTWAILFSSASFLD